jgi:hypothetical protein
MTERNSVFKANGQMLTNKAFNPVGLQVASANFNPIASVSHSPVYAASDREVVGDATINWTSNAQRLRSTLHYIVYDSENRTVYATDFPTNLPSGSLGIDLPDTLNRANLTAMVFCTALEGDKKLISQTYSFAVA